MRILNILLVTLSLAVSLHAAEDHAEKSPWWDAKWPARKKLVINTSDKGIAITDPIGTSPVLVRLHDGNFSFMSAREDGSDLRFVAEDGKTELKHHIEKWDGLLNEAYVWVQVPEVKPSAETTFWLYYGNVTDAANTADDKGTYDESTLAVYHFGDAGSVSKDSSGKAAALENTTPPGPGVIGGGHRLLGQASITIPDSPSLAWTAGGNFTFSAWFKAGTDGPDAILFSRRDGTNTFLIGTNNGVPFVEINKQRSAAGEVITPSVWHHIAAVVEGSKTTLFVDGNPYSNLATGLPPMTGAAQIGKDSTGSDLGFVGDIDEVELSKTARPAGFIKFASVSQGTSSEATKLVEASADEFGEHAEESELMKHVSLLADISKDLTPDGWAVIFLCSLMAVVGWGVAVAKFFYLNKVEKATTDFLKRWESVSTDLTALDQGDAEAIRTLGGTATGKKAQRLMKQSPLYHIYHLGCNEINARLQNAKEGFKGLSGRSIQAIKATLHGGLMREVQKLNSKLVLLTISIAGGPYLGLLGTVIGVMITFAVIAKSGQVEVNSIAPGIAGALLATVAGLAVAIPALFMYSYLASRIKDAVTNMETFIDEFIAKMAEHHKETNS